MLVPMWEWVVTRDARDGPVGVSMTRQGAMEALAKALVRGGRPSSGRVVPMKLSRPIHREPHYLRELPERMATYDGVVIQWSLTERASRIWPIQEE